MSVRSAISDWRWRCRCSTVSWWPAEGHGTTTGSLDHRHCGSAAPERAFRGVPLAVGFRPLADRSKSKRRPRESLSSVSAKGRPCSALTLHKNQRAFSNRQPASVWGRFGKHDAVKPTERVKVRLREIADVPTLAGE